MRYEEAFKNPFEDKPFDLPPDSPSMVWKGGEMNLPDPWGLRDLLNRSNCYYNPDYNPKWWNIVDRIKAWWYWRQIKAQKEKRIQRVMGERNDDRTGAIQFIEYCDKIEYEKIHDSLQLMNEQLLGVS